VLDLPASIPTDRVAAVVEAIVHVLAQEIAAELGAIIAERREG
jgi:hypothetical protein